MINAHVSEPGNFKDRTLLRDPHQMIEGALIAAHAVGAEQIYFYVRSDWTAEIKLLEAAIEDARAYCFVGKLEGGGGCEACVYVGGGAAICGETFGVEAAIVGCRPVPSMMGHPSVVIHSVETVCQVKHVLSVAHETLTRVFAVGGGVQRPGCYEFPCGSLTLGELIYDVAGGLVPGRKLRGVFPCGVFSKCVAAEALFALGPRQVSLYDLPMDFDTWPQLGLSMGRGSVIVIDDAVNVRSIIVNLMRFFATEICGFCVPCREGSRWLHQMLERIQRGEGRPSDVELMLSLTDQMRGRVACPFGEFMADSVHSLVTLFREDLKTT
ncbi:MAG: hypothetical protein A2Y14_02915 [Verrucomicrobia bacterium GWF2_51_19]|nr:MAG: hypothetical protein A2Y14_02915 [Verrucomicrobia bacterium GWF2_51_19]